VSRDVELKLRLTADGRVLVSQINKADKSVKQFAVDADKAGRKAGVAFTLAKRAAAGLAAALSAGAFADAIKQTIDFGDKVQKLSDRLGISTEALTQYQHVANLSGVSFQTLTLGLQRMTRRVSEAANGTGEAKDALKELGLSAVELEKLKPDQQFEVLAEAISRVKDSSDRVRIAMKLFDTDGVALLQTMTQGAAGIRQMRQEADALGLTLSRQEADEMAKYNDQITKMSGLFQGLAREIASDVVPSLNRFLETLNNIFSDTLDNQIARIENFESLGGLGKALADYTGYDINLEKNRLDILKKQKKAMEDQLALQKSRVDVTAGTDLSSHPASPIAPAKPSSIDKISRTYQDATGPASEWLKLQHQAEQVIRQTRTPLERLNKSIARYSTLADRGLISQETLNRALKQAGEEYNRLTNTADDNNKNMTIYAEQAARNIQDAFAQFLFDPFDKGLDGMLKGFARVLQRMAAEQAAAAIFAEGGLFGKKGLNGLVKSGANAASSVIADVVASFFHTGGIAGSPAVAHAVPAVAFAGAPRYHSGGVAGLKPDEVPAILKRGEEVLTANDPRHRDNLGGGFTINMTVVTNNADSFRRSEGQIGFDMAEELKRWKDING
jgi:hypothetical protein